MKKAGVGNGQQKKEGLLGRLWKNLKRRAPGVAANAGVSVAVGRAQLAGDDERADTIKGVAAGLGLLSLFLPDGALLKAGEGAMHGAVAQYAAQEGAAASTLVLPLAGGVGADADDENELDADELADLERAEETAAEETTEETEAAQEVVTVEATRRAQLA